MIQKDEYCLQCKKITPHISYSEEREYEYLGVIVDITENGFVCSICGDEVQSTEQYKEALEDMREDYYLKTGRKV